MLCPPPGPPSVSSNFTETGCISPTSLNCTEKHPDNTSVFCRFSPEKPLFLVLCSIGYGGPKNEENLVYQYEATDGPNPFPECRQYLSIIYFLFFGAFVLHAVGSFCEVVYCLLAGTHKPAGELSSWVSETTRNMVEKLGYLGPYFSKVIETGAFPAIWLTIYYILNSIALLLIALSYSVAHGEGIATRMLQLGSAMLVFTLAMGVPLGPWHISIPITARHIKLMVVFMGIALLNLVTSIVLMQAVSQVWLYAALGVFFLTLLVGLFAYFRPFCPLPESEPRDQYNALVGGVFLFLLFSILVNSHSMLTYSTPIGVSDEFMYVNSQPIVVITLLFGFFLPSLSLMIWKRLRVFFKDKEEVPNKEMPSMVNDDDDDHLSLG